MSGFSEDDRDAFAYLADRYEGTDVGELCEIVLQSDSEVSQS